MIKDSRIFNYKQYSNCFLMWGEYEAGGRTSLQIFDIEGPITNITINLPEQPLNNNEIFVKSYSENEGMIDFLVKEGFVEDTGQRVQTGYVEAVVAKLLIQLQ